MKHVSILLLLCLLTLGTQLWAQDWNLTGTFNFNVTQNAYSNSWAGTEKGAITWTAGSNMSAEKQLNPLFFNVNTLKLAFGQTHQQETDSQGENYWAKPVKSTDNIDAESLLKMTMQTFVNPFVGLRVESQFLDLTDPSLTRIVNPLKFTESAGITRSWLQRGNEALSSRFGAAFRQNLNRDVLISVVPEQRENQTTIDGGLEFVTEYKNVFTPSNVSYNTKLQIYQALFNSKSDDYAHEEWKSPDVNWEHNLGMRIWGALSLNLYLQLLYEKEQISELQFKETMGLGFSYNLF